MPSEVRHPKAKARRDLLRRLGVCINGATPPEYHTRRVAPPRVEHGPPASKSGRCQRCDAIHKGRR